MASLRAPSFFVPTASPSFHFLSKQRASVSEQIKNTGGDVLAKCQSVASGVITQVLIPERERLRVPFRPRRPH